MQTNNFFGRRDFIKYGLISSLFLLSGCSISKKKLVLRGVPKSFPSEFINTLPTNWEFLPIKDIESKKFPFSTALTEKTDLLVLNDGWISSLPFGSIKEIKATNIRNDLSKQAQSFLEGLGENYKNRIFPLTASPWVILLRNRDSLVLKNQKSWETIFSDSLFNQIVFPNSPYLLISIGRKLGFGNNFSKFKNQAKLFDDRNALNWILSGRANAAVLPLSSCIDYLVRDPRLSVLFPDEGSPLNWTVLASPLLSNQAFPSNSIESLWGPTNSRRVIRKGFFLPTVVSDLRRQDMKVSKKYQSKLFPEESFWNKCWSLPLLSLKEKTDLAINWNNS